MKSCNMLIHGHICWGTNCVKWVRERVSYRRVILVGYKENCRIMTEDNRREDQENGPLVDNVGRGVRCGKGPLHKEREVVPLDKDWKEVKWYAWRVSNNTANHSTKKEKEKSLPKIEAGWGVGEKLGTLVEWSGHWWRAVGAGQGGMGAPIF